MRVPCKYLSPICLTCGLILLVSYSFGQRSTRDLNRQGDIYFDNAQYYVATTYYLQSLEINKDDPHANYHMAECHRNLFEYPQAEAYYKKVSEKFRDRYPLAAYYYPLMQKLNGKFDQAIVNFDAFVEFAVNSKSRTLAENPIYIEQAKVEKEGCLLALNQLSSPVRDFGFKNAKEPVNSEYNDYAATPYSDDTRLIITSGRSGGKGGALNVRFGESFSDNYRFSLENGKWEEYKEKDGFKNLNGKWGDGAGAFAKNSGKYYYTRCNIDNKEGCQIYVTQLVEGEWSEPKPLNRNINVPKYGAKQPALTHGGDTLFFVSNRPGGSGDNDIWMSISSGNDNWGAPINLGEQVNTIFNEISPYYFEEENILFFASDGHRGFGGLDIYMAKGRDFTDPEIFNMGYPFNSNRDDAFFVLGIEKGFLSSNRKKGLGKFDIYSFDYNTGRAIVAEIGTEEAIAGRNSLFSDDYEFDSDDQVMIEKVISVLVAARLYGVELAFTDQELEFYQNLSEDDKKRISRIVNSRVRNISGSDLAAIRNEDRFYYDNLEDEEKENVDGILTKYLEEKGLSATVGFEESDQVYYENISSQDKQKLERFIARVLKESSTEDKSTSAIYQSTLYSKMTTEEKEWLDRTGSSYLSEKRNLSELALSTNDKLYLTNLSPEEKERLTYALRERMAVGWTANELLLSDEEQQFFQSLSAQEKQYVYDVAAVMISADPDNFYETLSTEQLDFLTSRSGAEKQTLDKIIATYARNIYIADEFFYESLRGEEKERMERFITAFATATQYRNYVNALNQNDKNYYEKLSAQKKNRIDRVVSSQAMKRKYGLTGKNVLLASGRDEQSQRPVSGNNIESYFEGQGLTLSTEEIQALGNSLDSGFKAIPSASMQYFFNLPTEEKVFVAQLLEGNVKTAGILSSDSEYKNAYNYYQNADARKKDMINDIVDYPFNKGMSFLKSLPAEKRAQSAVVARNYFISESGSLHISPTQEDIAFYQALDANGRETFHKASGLDQYNNLTPEQKNYYENLPTRKKARVASIIGTSLVTNGNVSKENLSKEDREFYAGLSTEEKEMIQSIVASPLLGLNIENLFFYQDLSKEDKERLGRMNRAELTSDLALNYSKLSAEDKEFLDQLPAERRDLVNRVLAHNYNATSEAGKGTYEKLNKEEKDFVDRVRSNYAIARGNIALGLVEEDSGKQASAQNDKSEEEAIQATLNKLNESELEKLAKEDITYYKELTSANRRVVDRIAAINTTKAEYAANPDLYEYDMEYLKTLDKTERQIVRRLAAELMADADNPQITEEEKNYYQHMSPEKRNKINRLVVVEALKANSADDIELPEADRKYYAKLEAEEKGKIDRITRMRRASNRVIGYDLETDLVAADETNIIAVVNTFQAGDFENVTITGKLYNIYTGLPAYGVEIPLLDKTGEVVKITTTNKQGLLRYVNLPAGQEFTILAGSAKANISEPPKYFIKDLKVEGIRTSDLDLVGYDNIYFDINSKTLRPEAREVLDELVKLAKSNPTLQIEINAYTDNTGSDEYNLQLSQERGQAAFNYMVQKGTDRSSLVINPRGKSDPIASNNSQFGRQFNRRVEFNLNGKDVDPDLKYITYISKPGSTYKEIAEAHGMAVKELLAVNGKTNPDEVIGYQPVRILATAEPVEKYLFERTATSDQFLYKVKKGDTVFSLARRFEIPEELLMETNGLKDPSDLQAGQTLTIYTKR